MSKVLGTMSQNTSHNHEHSSWLAYILPNNILDFTNEKMKRIVTQSHYNSPPHWVLCPQSSFLASSKSFQRMPTSADGERRRSLGSSRRPRHCVSFGTRRWSRTNRSCSNRFPTACCTSFTWAAMSHWTSSPANLATRRKRRRRWASNATAGYAKWTNRIRC